MSAIADISDRYVNELAQLEPGMALALGLPTVEDSLTDYSPDGHAARAELRSRTRAELVAAEAEDDRDAVARRVMLERFDYAAELQDAGEWRRDLNILASPFQSIRSIFDLLPRESADDHAAIARRMSQVPQALERYRASLHEGAQRGIVPARRQVIECARQGTVWAGAPGSSFFDNLIPDGESLPASVLADLQAGAASAARAYAATARWLADVYLPRAEPRDFVGPERYERAARGFLGERIDLHDTYQWGWEEVWRIGDQMLAAAEQIAPGQGIAGAIAQLEADDARAIDGEDAFRDWMQRTQDETMQRLNGEHFDIPEPVQRIEAMIAPPGGALAMYYTGPTEDFSRPGRTWYPTGGATRFPLWRELSVCYHEGVPGHHLQIGTTRWLGERLSRFQRLLAGTSGYVEGWALYAERLMDELGYFEDPAYRMGYLSSQGLRAARVVADIGMHLELEIPERERHATGELSALAGADRWRPELALPFLLERSRFPATMLASEVDRYLGWPGQAISYKVGERVWLQVRQQAKQSEGSAFNLKHFHAKALDLGPMGLAQLREELTPA